MEGVLEVHSSHVETLHAGGLDLPYIEFTRSEPAIKLVYNGDDYWYVRTLPLRGYGPVMARHIRELQSNGNRPLLARFRPGANFRTSQHWERIYLYATGVTPIGAAKK